MRIDGSCHCGRIRYEAEINPADVTICHCTDCQTLSGTAFRIVAPASRDAFTVTGDPKVYVKTAESGNKRAQAFCPECGTPLYATAPTDPQVYSIRLGTARQRAELPPRKQIWTRSALGWVMQAEAISALVASREPALSPTVGRSR
jgi:hypothetical protein